MKIIRWKYFIPVAIVVAAVVLFFVLFFDPLLAWGIETVGSKVNGAKVEVDGLKTKIFKGRLDIARLQVTNKELPMENVVEAGPLAFQMQFPELIKKRVVINESSLLGLAFGTPRKTSGALPRVAKKENEKPSAASKLVSKYQDRFKFNLDGMKDAGKEKIKFDPKELALVKQGDELKEKATTLPDRWEARVDGLKVEDRLKKAEADIKSVKETPTKGPEAITAIPEGLKKLKQVKEDLNAIKTDVVNVKKEFVAEAASIRGGVRGLAGAKKKDMDDILSRFNLDFANPQRLLDGMVGPAVLTKFQTVLGYAQKARHYMPSKIEKASLPPPPKRSEGTTIEFPTPAAPPRFWLQHAALGGVFQGIEASGALAHLTTDPPRVGKPLTVDLKGRKETQTFSAKGLLDATGDNVKVQTNLEGNGLPLKGFISEGPLGEALTAGVGSVRLAAGWVEGGQISGEIGLIMKNLKLDTAALLKQVGAQPVDPNAPKKGLLENPKDVFSEDELKAGFIGNLVGAIEKQPEVSIVGKLSGTLEDPSIALSSNLLSVFGDVIKKSVGDLVAKQRAQLEAELDALVKKKTAEVEEKLKAAEAKVNNKLAEAEKKAQDKINEATGLNLASEDSPIPGVKIPNLKGLFKK